MKTMLSKFYRHTKLHGLRSAVQKSANVVAEKVKDPPLISVGHKSDVIGHFSDIFGKDLGSEEALKRANPDSNTIQWVIPNFGFGSGGHLNIFRFINLLEKRGFKQKIVILPPHNWKDSLDAANHIKEWYFPINAEVALSANDLSPSHITVATGWQTAYVVSKFHATRKKFYFVQDFEPNFYPVSSEYYMAEETYRLGLKGITAGSWLKTKLSSEYGMDCSDFSFSYDKDFYTPTKKRNSENFNLLFYSRHVTKRRLFELGLCALDMVCRQNPNVAVIFAGGDVSQFRVPFHHLNAGELSLSELPDLYSQSDLSLVLSGTNLSLLPLELVGCGCPVVMNDAPSSEWLLPKDSAFYAPMTPQGLAQTISEAVNNDSLRKSVIEKAKVFASASSWEVEADKVAEAFRNL